MFCAARRVGLGFAIVLLLSAAPVLAASLSERAAQSIVDQVVAELPEGDIHLRLLAVTDIDGDQEEQLSRALTAAINERTEFVLVEKANMEKLLEEQGWQLSDLVNPEARVQFGEMLAAEGILFGNVLEWQSGFQSAHIRVHLQLDDVQRGVIVFSRQFEASVEAPERAIYVALAAFLVAIVLVAVLIRIVRIRRRKEDIETAVDQRQEALQQVRRAQRNLGDAREKMRRDGSPEVAEEVQAVEGDLDRLRLAIESAPAGRAFERGGERLSDKGFELDERAAGMIRGLVGSAERIFDRAQDKDQAGLSEALAELRTGIKDVHSAFLGRDAG
jgi:hypothetical protein